MDVEKAKLIIKENIFYNDSSQTHAIMRGLQILAKYEEDIVPDLMEHGVFKACGFDKTVERMSEEEVVLMAKMGWYFEEEGKCFEEEIGCWAHY
jgi:hypothetical protein